MTEQFQIPSVSTEGIGGTVWVVVANMMDNPHPEVLGVYTNENAAREHEKQIRKDGYTIREDGYDWPVASFDVRESEIKSNFGGKQE